MLKRLFKAINLRSEREIRSACEAIIEKARKDNHFELANELVKILNPPTKISHTNFNAPIQSLSRFPQKSDPLFSVTEPELLNHDMVVSAGVEKQIFRLEKEFAARGRLANHGFSPRKKVLLYGPSGCGKRLSANRLAWSMGLKLVHFSFEHNKSLDFEKIDFALTSVFDFCAKTPSVLLISNIDFDAGLHGESNTSNLLLKLLDRYRLPGLTMVTTDQTDKMKKDNFSYFDEIILIEKPGTQERLELFSRTFAHLYVEKDLNWDYIVSMTKDFSAAEIIRVGTNAAKDAILNDQSTLKEVHLQRAINELVR